MIRRLTKGLVCCCILFALSSCAAEESVRASDWEQEIPELMETFDIPGAVIAVMEHGDISRVSAFGYADTENGVPMRTDTVCRVESISKSLTAWGVMHLVEQGALDVHAPALSYLNTWSPPQDEPCLDQITIGQLLSHQAGLDLGTIGVTYDPRGPVPSLEQQLTQDLRCINGQQNRFFYSNTGYNLLEKIIEDVTHTDFAEYMETEILRPLGMETATFSWDEGLNIPDGHDSEGHPIPAYVYPDKASGGLFATISDIAAFLSAGMNPSSSAVLSQQAVDQIYREQAVPTGYYGLVFDGYGYGHFIEELENGLRAYSHGGQGTGWMTHFHSIPETGDAVIILTNSQRSWPFISAVLNRWGEETGFAPLGMGLIEKAGHLLRVVLIILSAILVIKTLFFISAVRIGKRTLSALHPDHLLIRILNASAALLIAVSIIWALSQPYLFITSVFPIESPYLLIIGVYSVVLFSLQALFPPAYHSREKFDSTS